MHKLVLKIVLSRLINYATNVQAFFVVNFLKIDEKIEKHSIILV